MGSEPPSRLPPRGQPQETKAARDELSSKNKVEKVREVDADETRKRKFKSFLDDDKPAPKKEDKPSLFEISSKEAYKVPKFKSAGSIEGLASRSEPGSRKSKDSKEKEKDPLPQSEDFWEEVDLPADQRPPERNLKEAVLPEKGTPRQVFGKEEGIKPHKEPGLGKEKKAQKEEGSEQRGAGLAGAFTQESKVEDRPARKEERLSKEEREVGFDSGVKSVSPRIAEKEKFHFSPADLNEVEEEEGQLPSVHAMEKKEKSTGKEADPKILEIASGSRLPASVQPATVAATQQANPYLHPTTTALFFQMVGQIYIMTTTGVSRTEILLNNPSFAGSRFFGSTITIEKYATAPDSFNIRLTGSEEAVLSFRQNAASLMSAFQNGNFTFKVNRLDAEYTLEKPVYRRKEKDEGKDERGGGLGERRK